MAVTEIFIHCCIPTSADEMEYIRNQSMMLEAGRHWMSQRNLNESLQLVADSDHHDD